MTEPQPPAIPKLPRWAKVLLIAFVVGTMSLMTFLAYATWWMAQQKQAAHDPSKMPLVAQAIAKFQEPLPAGLTYQTAAKLLGWRFVVIKDTSDGTMFSFTTMPNGKHRNAQDLLSMLIKSGLEQKSYTKKNEGERLVGGQRMAYAQGTTTDLQGKESQEMLGVVTPKSDPDIYIQFVGVTRGKTYNQSGTDKLLDAIKGF